MTVTVFSPAPEHTGEPEWCAPVDDEHVPYWILRYDDADVPDAIVTEEAAARRAFASAEAKGWNCHLFHHAPRTTRQSMPTSDTQGNHTARLKGRHLADKGYREIGRLYEDPDTGKRAVIDEHGRVEWLEA